MSFELPEANKLNLVISNYVRSHYEYRCNQQHIPIALKYVIMKFSNKIIPCQLLNIQQDLAFYQLLAVELPNIRKFHLLFKASDHNFCNRKFHALCDNKGATITIIKTNHGNIFGGYTSKSWSTPKSNHAWSKDQNAFLFLIKSEDESIQNECPIILKIKKNRADHAVLHKGDLGPTFGADIIIRSECNKPSKAIYSFYHRIYEHGILHKKKFLCGGNYSDKDHLLFQILDYQVFKVHR